MVLLLTGTCGSGKSTVACLLASDFGWEQVAEDPVWQRLYGRQRGAFGSEEHRTKRAAVHREIFARVATVVGLGRDCVIEATVHQTPPEAFLEYHAFLTTLPVPWALRVLQPRLEVAIARDAARAGWHAGAERVANLHAKFIGSSFHPAWFVDTSSQTPQETAGQLDTLRVG